MSSVISPLTLALTLIKYSVVQRTWYPFFSRNFLLNFTTTLLHFATGFFITSCDNYYILRKLIYYSLQKVHYILQQIYYILQQILHLATIITFSYSTGRDRDISLGILKWCQWLDIFLLATFSDRFTFLLFSRSRSNNTFFFIRTYFIRTSRLKMVQKLRTT